MKIKEPTPLDITFEQFGFDERIQKAIDEASYKVPMPVQGQCFDLLLKEQRDIYAQSQTGTGKTAAFLLGIFQLIVSNEKYKDGKALVIVPTRELAVQIEKEAILLSKYLDLHIGSVYGGTGYKHQEDMLEKGLDIVIGTPGRLIDFGRKAKLNFKEFSFLVIDEADRLFDMGFLPDLRKIIDFMRPKEDRITLLFSATLNPRVGNLAWEYMKNPGEIIIEPEKMTVDTVTQELYHVGKGEKVPLLLGLLKKENPKNAVIFTNTRQTTWELAKRMEANGFPVKYLMGALPQTQRMKIVEEVKKGKHKFLVATDVAARGLHIEGLDMVINYDVPLEPESYIHRIGRTARAGSSGKTITMACEEYVYGLSAIEELLGEKIPVSWADDKLLISDKSASVNFSQQSHQNSARGDRNGGAQKSRRDRDQRSKNDKRRSREPKEDRMASIQSAISSVAGGMPDMLPEQKTPNNKKGSPKRRNSGGRDSGQRKGKKESPLRENAGKSKKSNNVAITSKTKIDDRLEYYQQKYGDVYKVDNGEFSDSDQSSRASVAKSRRRKKGALGRLFGKKQSDE